MLVSRVDVTINGTQMPSIKAVREGEFETAKQVMLMRQTDTVDVTGARTLEIDYVVPGSGSEYDWESLSAALIILALDGGRRKLYRDCRTLKVGSAAYDGQAECVKTVTIASRFMEVE
jgi:hypothetical protein